MEPLNTVRIDEVLKKRYHGRLELWDFSRGLGEPWHTRRKLEGQQHAMPVPGPDGDWLTKHMIYICKLLATPPLTVAFLGVEILHHDTTETVMQKVLEAAEHFDEQARAHQEGQLFNVPFYKVPDAPKV
jgi:hypothetical protein